MHTVCERRMASCSPSDPPSPSDAHGGPAGPLWNKPGHRFLRILAASRVGDGNFVRGTREKQSASERMTEDGGLDTAATRNQEDMAEGYA